MSEPYVRRIRENLILGNLKLRFHKDNILILGNSVSGISNDKNLILGNYGGRVSKDKNLILGDSGTNSSNLYIEHLSGITGASRTNSGAIRTVWGTYVQGSTFCVLK